MRSLRALIFDFNGVLIDDEHLHFRAFCDVLAEEGHTLTEMQYFERYLGLDDRTCLRSALLDRGEVVEPIRLAGLALRKAAVYRLHLKDGLRLFPDALEVIPKLAGSFVLAIASGARRREIDFVLERTGLQRYFQAVVSADDVDTGKPDPEVYFKAVARLRRHPSYQDLERWSCLAIEDSASGIRAAQAAGMRCVAVTTSRPTGALLAADWIVACLGGLDPVTLESWLRASGRLHPLPLQRADRLTLS